MIERRIKELAIAMEALSRVNSYDAVSHMNNVSSLLEQAIQEAKDQNRDPTPTRPVANTQDDDIPF